MGAIAPTRARMTPPMSESREPVPRAEFGRVGCVATVDVCGHGGCAYVRWEGDPRNAGGSQAWEVGAGLARRVEKMVIFSWLHTHKEERTDARAR